MSEMDDRIWERGIGYTIRPNIVLSDTSLPYSSKPVYYYVLLTKLSFITIFILKHELTCSVVATDTHVEEHESSREHNQWCYTYIEVDMIHTTVKGIEGDKECYYCSNVVNDDHNHETIS
jgi:hypothetical protein